MASISASRELEDGRIAEWNDCWAVKNEGEAKDKALLIAQYFGLNKIFLNERTQMNTKKTSYFDLPLKQPPPFVMLDVNPLHESERDGAILEILELYDNGDINILIPSTVRMEMNNNIEKVPLHAQNLLNKLLFTVYFELTYFEQAQKEIFLSTIRGKTQSENIDVDLSHIFEAAKYHAKYFITRDKKLSSKTRKKKIKSIILIYH